MNLGDEITLKRDDLLSKLINVKDNESNKGIDDYMIISESLTFLFAGHDTTSNLLSWATYFLCKHPDIQQKLRDHTSTTLKRQKITNFEQVNQLTYCKYVLQETLRLCPVVPVLQRITCKDVEFGGFKIPAQTNLTLNFYGAHHNPKYWVNPESFIPERFAYENEDSDKYNFVFLPFSAGPRNCIGAKFALQEAIIILSNLVLNFDLILEDPNKQVRMASRGAITPVDLFVKFIPKIVSNEI